MEDFGRLPDGRAARLHTLTNSSGMTAGITDFGAALVSLKAPDRGGIFADVTLGFDSVEGYAGDNNPYFGATVGRYGNRIAGGKFSLDGKEYRLATNNDPAGIPCHLHGGNIGFNKRLWTVEASSPDSIDLKYVSPDGEEGYPGTLTARVRYRLTEDDELLWEATATTDAPTIVNMVQHAYWNLSGDPTTSIRDHLLTLHADRYLPTNAGLIPTGEMAQVEGTPMDFTEPTSIGSRLDADFEALKPGLGYDHCWILTRPEADGLALAARLSDPGSGRIMEVRSNQPGIQFYGGNFLNDSIKCRSGKACGYRTALCLETENLPDAPNRPDFPSPVLRPGETYTHRTAFRFRAE